MKDSTPEPYSAMDVDERNIHLDKGEHQRP